MRSLVRTQDAVGQEENKTFGRPEIKRAVPLFPFGKINLDKCPIGVAPTTRPITLS